jgi:23S rRNA pseudouridine1911/1915/1917 synthase
MKNRGYAYPDRVLPRDEGVPVAAFYALRYPHSTEETWRRRIEAGQVLLNGRPASPDEALKGGDRLSYLRLPWDEPDAPREFETLFEDPDVLVLAKPSGLPLPGPGTVRRGLLAASSARTRHVRGDPLHP